MERFDAQQASRKKPFKRITTFSIALLLLAIIVGGSAFLILTLVSAQTQQQKAAQLSAYSIHRSDEVPSSSHRTRSTIATQAPTSLMPWGIALDNAHGFVWVAEPGCEPLPTCPSTLQGNIGQYALSDGTFIQDFNEPAAYSSPLFTAVDANGHVWFTQPNTNAIGELNPQSGVWSQWPVKKGALPYDLAFDTHGNLWFTEFGSNNIGFFDPRTHTLVENPIPTAHSDPYGITVDPQGTVWFSENRVGVGQIGSFTPTTSGTVKIIEHPVTIQFDTQRPHLITADKAGNIWYTEGFSGYIGEFTPASGSSKNFLVYTGTCTPQSCTGTHISGIHADNKGTIWFSDSLSQHVGYLVPPTGQVVVKTLPDGNAHPHDGLTIDSSNRIWFTEQNALTLVVWPIDTVR